MNGMAAAVDPDAMFVHGGRLGRMPVIVRALRTVGVPTKAICDFDVLRDEANFFRAVEAFEIPRSDVERDWNAVKEAVDAKKPELNSEEVKKEIRAALDAVTTAFFDSGAAKTIRSILNCSTPWKAAKEAGINIVPSGTARKACDRLLARLVRGGVHVIEVGELESFNKMTGGHGPAWVNEVMKKDLVNDASLASARAFVSSLRFDQVA